MRTGSENKRQTARFTDRGGRFAEDAESGIAPTKLVELRIERQAAPNPEIVLAVVRLDLDGNGQDVDRVALALFRTQVEIEVTEQEVGSSAAESPFLFDRVIVGNAQVAVRRRTRSAHHEHDIAFLDRAE